MYNIIVLIIRDRVAVLRLNLVEHHNCSLFTGSNIDRAIQIRIGLIDNISDITHAPHHVYHTIFGSTVSNAFMRSIQIQIIKYVSSIYQLTNSEANTWEFSRKNLSGLRKYKLKENLKELFYRTTYILLSDVFTYCSKLRRWDNGERHRTQLCGFDSWYRQLILFQDC